MSEFLVRLTDKHPKYNNLISLKIALQEEFCLTPRIGAELEFYLLKAPKRSQVLALEQSIDNFSLRYYSVRMKKERGCNQYEVEIAPSDNAELYPEIIIAIREFIIQEANKLNLEANFRSKPFKDDYGNSMHIHLDFLENENCDDKEQRRRTEKYARALCHYLPATIKAFLPKEEDYMRLDGRYLAPTHISYGNNNRTTMIRIPDSLPRRIEHRLAAASSDPYAVITAILFSVYEGLKSPEIIANLDKTYGNAYDPQYNLIKIIDV